MDQQLVIPVGVELIIGRLADGSVGMVAPVGEKQLTVRKPAFPRQRDIRPAALPRLPDHGLRKALSPQILLQDVHFPTPLYHKSKITRHILYIFLICKSYTISISPDLSTSVFSGRTP